MQTDILGTLPGAGAIQISPDGKWLFAVGVVSSDGFDWKHIARLWSLESGKARDISIRGWSLDWTRDSRLLDLGPRYKGDSSSPTAWILSPRDGKIVQSFGDEHFGAADDIQDADFSPDGKEFWLLTKRQFRRFASGNSKLLKRLDWGDSRTRRSQGSENIASFSADGREIMQGETQINFYSAHSGQRLRRLRYLRCESDVSFASETSFRELMPTIDKEMMKEMEGNKKTYYADAGASNYAIRRAKDGKMMRIEKPLANESGVSTAQNARFIFRLDGDTVYRIAK